MELKSEYFLKTGGSSYRSLLLLLHLPSGKKLEKKVQWVGDGRSASILFEENPVRKDENQEDI